MAYQGDPSKILDSLRHRLQTLTTDLYSLLSQLHLQPPQSKQQQQQSQSDSQQSTDSLQQAAYIPPWPELQSSVLRTTTALNDVLATLANNNAFLSGAHVYPLPGFPGRSLEAGEGMLRELLRKRLEPGSEDWVLKGQQADAEIAAASAGKNGGDTAGGQQAPLSEKDFEQLWEWAGPAENEVARKLLMGVVVAGDEDDEDDEDEDDEDDEDRMDIDRTAAEKKAADAKPMLPLEDILRFMYAGNPGAGQRQGVPVRR